MKTVKSLLLGTAALVIGSFSAQAADLAAAEPVEYVRICDAFGAGYFFIPGSADTCLRISGYVRSYFAYQARNQNQGDTGFGNGVTDTIVPVLVNATGLNGLPVTGSGGLVAGTGAGNAFNFANFGILGNANPAQQAGLGPNFIAFANAETRDQYVSGVRALLRFDARTKTEFGILRSFFEFAAASSNAARNGTGLQVRYGFVQFGGLTAGVTDSFFNTELTNAFLSPIGDRSQRLPVLAYTHSFGNGISATISAEESGIVGGVGGSASSILNGATTAAAGGISAAFVRRAVQLPDLIGNLRVSQSWGSAQVSGAVGQYRFANTSCQNLLVAVAGVCTANRVGWAITGHVQINLPQIAKGDNVLFKATYAEGALSYLGNVSSNRFFGNGVGAASSTVTAAAGWAVAAEFNHFFTPAIRAAIIGGYTRLDSTPGVGFGGNVAYLREAWNVYGQLFWTPIKDFDVGVEVFYQDNSYNFFGGTSLGNRLVATSGDNGWGGFFRAQRRF